MEYTKKGIAPPDYTSKVGQIRLVLSDTDYKKDNNDPAYGFYEKFSDEEIETALNPEQDINLALSRLYKSIAGRLGGVYVKEHDMTVDNRVATELYLGLSNSHKRDYEKGQTGAGDTFFEYKQM